MLKMKRRVAGVTAGVVASLALMTPAFAEGSFSSSLSRVYTGFNSRTWTDRNSDSAHTLVQLQGCKFNDGETFQNTTLQLTYENTFTPDENMGWRTLACKSSATGDWGDVKAGDYQFAIMRINGQSSTAGSISASYVGVSY